MYHQSPIEGEYAPGLSLNRPTLFVVLHYRADVILLARLEPLAIRNRPRHVWTTQTMQSRADSVAPFRLTLSYRFACPPDYYGEACERYCAPRDSLLGHYKCDPKEGRIVCLPGWGGSQCTEGEEF